MIFAVFMIAAAVAATILIGIIAGNIWGALAFAGLALGIYRAMTYQSTSVSAMTHDQLNAFQRPLSDD